MHFILNPSRYHWYQIPCPKFQRLPTPNAETDGYTCISWDLVFGIWNLGLIKKCTVLRRLQYISLTLGTLGTLSTLGTQLNNSSDV